MPQRDVVDGKLFGEAVVGRAVVRIFADAEKEVKCDDGHLAYCFVFLVCRRDGSGVEVSGYGEGHGKLWLCRRVRSFVAFQLLADGFRVACFLCSQRVLFSVQLELRGDGSERQLDRLGSYRRFGASNAAGSHMVCEGSQYFGLFCHWEGGEVVWDANERRVKPFGPSLPKAPARIFSRCHDASGDGR